MVLLGKLQTCYEPPKEGLSYPTPKRPILFMRMIAERYMKVDFVLFMELLFMELVILPFVL